MAEANNAIKKLQKKLFEMRNASPANRNAVRSYIDRLKKAQEDLKQLEEELVDLEGINADFVAPLMGNAAKAFKNETTKNLQTRIGKAKTSLKALVNGATKRKTRRNH